MLYDISDGPLAVGLEFAIAVCCSVSLAFACIDEARDPKFVVRLAGVNAPDCTCDSVLVGMVRIPDVWFRFVVRG
jgi:hypothetical protein